MTETVRRLALSLLGGVALLLGTLGTAAADPRVLGSRTVGYGTDHDSIAVSPTVMFSSVRLCVGGRSVDMYDLDIFFANGGRQDAAVRLLINPGECTRWIDLSGGMRHVVQISLTYSTAASTGTQAVVTAYGR